MEPCPLCLSTTVMANVPHIVFSSHDAGAGAASRQIVETVPYARRLRQEKGWDQNTLARAASSTPSQSERSGSTRNSWRATHTTFPNATRSVGK